MAQRPLTTGLFLCEQIIVEEKTRNITPVNCFTRRRVEQVPSEPFPFIAFALLTDGMGVVRLTLSIERLDTLDDVYQIATSYHFTNPLQEMYCIIRVRDCSFPVLGYYQASLIAENVTIAQRRFHVMLKENSV